MVVEKKMKLTMIHGRAGTGKSTYLFKKAREMLEQANQVYIITPEQFSFTAERKLLEEMKTGAVIHAEVLTFSRMAYRMIQENGNQLKNIENFGKSMLLYDILDKKKNELTFLGKNLQNVEVVSRCITELKKHNVSKERLLEVINGMQDEYLRAKLKDISLLYESFQEKLEERFVEENDTLTYLAEHIKDTDLFHDSVILIDEFARIHTTRI